jgi:mannose-6-phosphate isomerase-like protein (cupin superfamily)
MKTVMKPWGFEVHLGEYWGWRFKILHVNPHCRTSLQYHKSKVEIWLYYDGKYEIINPGDIHRLEAGDDELEVFEICRGHDRDIERIEDDYNRTT